MIPDAVHGEKVYQLCAACHGKNGWGKPDGSFPVIAGQHRQVIIKQLADIRARNRENPTMFPFSDPKTIGGVQAIADVAQYIQSLPQNKKSGIGNGDALGNGETLYQKSCQNCHGEKGDGLGAAFFPKLRGQHYQYLVRQIDSIKNGRRKNANPEMIKRVTALSDSDLSAISDYLSRIPAKTK